MARVVKFENVRVLRDGRLQDVDLWVANGKIVDPLERFWRATSDVDHTPDDIVDGRGCIVAPGFIDLQLNGGFGFDFSNPSTQQRDILCVRQRLAATGVTAFCPTIVSSSAAVYAQILRRYAPTTDGGTCQAANILGIHLEGPFISGERKGAHDPSMLAAPTDGMRSLDERYGSLENVRMVTLAPELPGACDAIRALSARGIVVSAGHSQATIQEAMDAVECGLTMLTHVFNAMGPFHHRDPGLIGLLGLIDRRPFYGLILDGVHSHRTSARIIRSCHPQGLVLVTDAMAGMGLPLGEYDLAGRTVVVTNEGAFLAGTNTIAGSAVTMDSCVRTLVAYTGCSVVEALEAATLHPAQVLGIETHKGTLAFGADADVVLLDETLCVQRTYVGGELVFDNFS